MKLYSFRDLVVLVNGVRITHFRKDDALQMAFREDAVSDEVGADGKMVVYVSADESAEITLGLQATSPSNKYLNSLAAAWRGGPRTAIPIAIQFQDVYRQDIGGGIFCYPKKVPDFGRGMEAAEMEWVYVAERAGILLANPTFLGLLTAPAESA